MLLIFIIFRTETNKNLYQPIFSIDDVRVARSNQYILWIELHISMKVLTSNLKLKFNNIQLVYFSETTITS